RRRMHDQIAPVLLVLTAPDQLRIEVGIARVTNERRCLLGLVQHRLVLRGGNVLALVLVLQRLDGLGGRSPRGLLACGHRYDTRESARSEPIKSSLTAD